MRVQCFSTISYLGAITATLSAWPEAWVNSFSVFVVCASVVKLCEVLCLCNYFLNFLWEILACVCAGMEDIRMVVVKVCAGVLM